jgi:hypothetical protein
MSTKFKCRPSEVLGLDDRTDAFFFDKAVFYFGTEVEKDLEEHCKDRSTKHPDKPEVKTRKREARLAMWLNTDEEGKRKFRDPNVNPGR